MRAKLLLICLAASLFPEEEFASALPPSLEQNSLVAKQEAISISPNEENQEGYTINYNTVSVIEYIRFASKICKVNFIYQEEDLDFTITVVSDEPVTPANVMATLIQVLRAHGLLLLEENNNLVIHKSTDVRQAATLVTDASQIGNSPIITRIFRIKNVKPESLAAIIQPMISSSAILEVSSETRQIILTDVTGNVEKISLLIENLDSSHPIFEIKSFEAQYNKPEYLISLANQIMAPLAMGNPFILVPQNLSGQIFIVSTPELVEKALTVFLSLDTVPKHPSALDHKLSGEAVFVYKAVNRTSDEVVQGLKSIASHLQGTDAATADLIHAIEQAKTIRETNSVMFVGTEASIMKIKEFLPAVDGSSPVGYEKASFFVYKPHYRTPNEIESSILEMAENLKNSKGAPLELIDTMRSVKINPQTHTLVFSGDEKSFPRVQELLSTIDTPTGRAKVAPASQFYIYRPQKKSGDQIVSSVKEVLQQLKSDKLADPGFLQALGTMKWVKSTQTLMFTGDPVSLEKVQQLIATIDIEGTVGKSEYYIYKVQNTTGDVIEEDLDNLAKNLESTGAADRGVIDVIAGMRYVKQTNSLLLNGDPRAIEEVKKLIAQYDYPREVTPASSNFFMYKPQHLPAEKIEKSLQDVGINLKKAGLADPSLLKTIETAKYVDTTNSLIFTGPPETLTKIQSLIKDIDAPPSAHKPIQHVGKTTFLLYKLQHASGSQVVSSLKAMAADLKKGGSTDKDFLQALGSIKYIKETNSLFFSGKEEALNRVQTLVEKFDVTGLADPAMTPVPTSGPSNFFVYRPQSLTGPDLEKLINDFAEHLRSSGLYDPDLFSAISSMRWTEKTQTLVFTGSQKSLDQVKELLKEFDIPSNSAESPEGLDGSIQAIDNTSFLVYKLQFHKGDEIQGALRQIAKDLTIANAPVNQGLLNSINSIQWLEVTNSLLCTGDQDTLTRLRELIKSLDIPLKQVFIEMLVIETTLTNSLNFGLEWGGNYKYRNKLGAASYNSQPIGSSGSPDTFLTKLSGLTPPTPPTPIGNIPVSSGFDLGVIGEVIRHNGETFLTLGSLLTALQTDDEMSIVMTPKLITQDGKTSSIFIGRNIPFVGSFVQNNSQTTVNTSNIEYRDIGFNLTVTPVLGNSDIVTLDIHLDRSQTLTNVSGAAINFNSMTAQGIVTTKTNMQTTVHVPDNHFLILSGMVDNANTKTKTGIPCLGGLPLVGAAFSKNGDTIVNSNIVIFLRPHIINSIDDMRSLTTKEEDFFRDQVGSPYLERNFDEAMELIKTIDDD
jgi:type III secretion protein C